MSCNSREGMIVILTLGGRIMRIHANSASMRCVPLGLELLMRLIHGEISLGFYEPTLSPGLVVRWNRTVNGTQLQLQ